MIADRFTFSIHSWHMRLMHWIWGWNHTHFRNMCPYFWLSVFNVLFIIPILIVKILIWFFFVINYATKGLVERYDAYCDEQETKWMQQVHERVKEDLAKGEWTDRLQTLWDSSHKNGRKYEKWYKIYDKFFDSDDHYEEWKKLHATVDAYKQAEYRKRIEKAETKAWELKLAKEEEEAKLQKKRTAQMRIAKLVIWTKRLLMLIGSLLAGGILYLLFLFFKWSTTWNWGLIGQYSIVSVLTCVIIACICILFYQLIMIFGAAFNAFWCRIGKFCIPCSERWNRFGNFLVRLIEALGSGIAYPFVKFWQGLVFVIEVLIAMKRDNCPALEWKEEQQ